MQILLPRALRGAGSSPATTGALAFLVLLLSPAAGAPVYLGVGPAEEEARPLVVLTGQNQELLLTLTSATVETPELSGDLFALTGGLAAPVFSNRALPLQRAGDARAGLQRFRFVVEIPAAERKQGWLLRLRIRSTATEPWLPLPAVKIEARPSTWKKSLGSFVHQLPSGKLAGSQSLDAVLQEAEIQLPATAAGEPVADQGIRVWFAEEPDGEFLPPGAPNALWVVFKKNGPGGLMLWRATPQSPPAIVVDGDILTRLATDPVAQELFERALATARTLLSATPE